MSRMLCCSLLSLGLMIACDGDGANGPPNIASFSGSTASLTEGESVTFTVSLSDPDGLADVADGSLTTPEGLPYGAFTRAEDPTTFTLTLSWDEVHQGAPIAFVGSESREFVAVFEDRAGHQARASTTIELTCDLSGACEGACVDVSSDVDHCGACGEACDDGAVCLASECLAHRRISGEILDPMVNMVVAISEEGVETISGIDNGAFELADLSPTTRYLIEFRNGDTVQGWLTFAAGAELARVIPAGAQDIDLGSCSHRVASLETPMVGLEFAPTNNPLAFTDDDGDGVADVDDGYVPRPMPEAYHGAYHGVQEWNGVQFDIEFVPSTDSPYTWAAYIYGSGSPDCTYPQQAQVESFGDGFVGVFMEAGSLTKTCQATDHLQFWLSGDPADELRGQMLHYMVDLNGDTCPAVGCLGSPPHGGDFTATRVGDATCE